MTTTKHTHNYSNSYMVRFKECYFLHVIWFSVSLALSNFSFNSDNFLISLFFLSSIYFSSGSSRSVWVHFERFVFYCVYNWCCCIFRIIKIVNLVYFISIALFVVDRCCKRIFSAQKTLSVCKPKYSQHTLTHIHKHTYQHTLTLAFKCTKILYQEIRKIEIDWKCQLRRKIV